MKRIGRIKKAALIFIISLLGLLLIVFFLINLPFASGYLSRKVNNIFNSSGIPVHINSITTILPWSVNVGGVLISDARGDSIIFAETVRSGLKPLPLLKKKVILKSVVLNGTRIRLLRNKGDDQLNIAEAFSGGKKKETVSSDAEIKPWEISLADAEIRKLSFTMNDSVGGIYISQDIKSISIEMRKMSLTGKTIIVKSLGIDGVTGFVTLDQHQADQKSESGSGWDISLEELTAGNINFVYDDQVNRQKLDLLAQKITVEANTTDLNRKIIDLHRIEVKGTSAVLSMDNELNSKPENLTSEKKYFDWNIRDKSMEMKDVAFRIAAYSDSAGYNPLSQVNVIGLGMTLSEFLLNRTDLNASVDNLKLDLGNGFSIKDLSANISSGTEKTRIDLEVETGNSILNLVGDADRNVFDVLNDPAGIKRANIALNKTSVSVEDLLYFKPGLTDFPGGKMLAEDKFDINGDLNLDGTLLKINKISVSLVNGFGISALGNVNNIFDPGKTVCDLKFKIDYLDNRWIRSFFNEMKQKGELPDFKLLSLEGRLTDSLKSPGYSIKLLSDFGGVDMKGSFDLDKDSFSMKTDFHEVRLGEIIKNKLLGSLTGSADISGSGLLKKNLSAEAVLLVDSIGFKDYVYKKTAVECIVQPGKYYLKLLADDPSLQMNLSANMDTKGPEWSGNIKGDIAADLFNLHLFRDSLFIRSSVSADFSKNLHEIGGGLAIRELRIVSPDDTVTIHNISASLRSDTSQTDIGSDADFFSASARINRPLDSVGQFLQGYIKYLESLTEIENADSVSFIPDMPLVSGRMSMDFNKVIRTIVPDTSLSFRNLSMSFGTNARQNKISYSLSGSGVKYNLLKADKINLSVTDSAAVINLSLHADTCSIGSQNVNRLSIQSHLHKWESFTKFSVIDKQSVPNYNIEFSSSIDSNDLTLQIPSGQITLNGVKWEIDSVEFMKIDLRKKSFSPSFRMHTGDSFISIFKDDRNEWENFNLALNNITISSFIRPDLLPGNPDMVLSGRTTYSRNNELGYKLASDLNFNDVSFYDLTYRKIALNGIFNSDTSGNFDFKINSNIDTSEIKISGMKSVKAGQTINTSIRLVPINTIQPFVSAYLSGLGGYISGEFSLRTKDLDNNFNGSLLVNDGKLRINTLNSSYRLPDNRISFTGKRIELNEFRVLDSLNNELVVNGFIDFSSKGQVLSDVEISSSNLQVLNREEEKNSTFFGDVFIDSKLSIKGPVTSPVLKGKILLAKGTDIYFKQSENLDLSESGSILTFESSNRPDGKKEEKSGLSGSLYNKSSVQSVVAIDPATRINIKISKKMFNIDLAIQGGGELNYNMLVNSQVNMAGKYEISDGGANLKMVGWPNKAFILTKGGSIRWDGKLDDPELNLEAINRVKSSYVNPVDNKERYVEFDVTLKISNRLSAMDISFTINTPDQYLMSIINTMSPEEQMRQAITILLFEYIDLPGISTSSNYVSEQVNQMVAAQLNSLTKTTIKGIDISFGIDTYTHGTSSGGQETKTSLSYEVKRNLLNDRAKVEFSGILSDVSNQSHSSNTSYNNFSFEYRIDSAATKFLKVYNEHSYEDVFEGDVIKTGVGFTYRRNYPSLGDIWRKKKKTMGPVYE